MHAACCMPRCLLSGIDLTPGTSVVGWLMAEHDHVTGKGLQSTEGLELSGLSQRVNACGCMIL